MTFHSDLRLARYLPHTVTTPSPLPLMRFATRATPPAWIGVGTRDLFHGEDLAYASRLTAAVSQNFRRAQLSALDTALNHEP
jgi:acetyl esterase/lipase